MRPKHPEEGIEDADPDGVAPAGDGELGPVLGAHVLHDSRACRKPLEVLDGDKVRVAPLCAHEIHARLLRLRQRHRLGVTLGEEMRGES